nr:hypothetical protein Iba_chr14fCG3310 [Ipomoea batatas]
MDSFAQACLTIPAPNIRPALRQTVNPLRFSKVTFLSRKLPAGRLTVDHSRGHLSQRLVHGPHETIRSRILITIIQIERDERRVGYPIYSVAYTRAAVGGGDVSPAQEQAVHCVLIAGGEVVEAVLAVGMGGKSGEERLKIGFISGVRGISRSVWTKVSERFEGSSDERTDLEADA